MPVICLIVHGGEGLAHWNAGVAVTGKLYFMAEYGPDQMDEVEQE